MLSTEQSNKQKMKGLKMKKTTSANCGNAVKHIYEATVKARALKRTGNCNNLNGHILEIMGADKTNLNPFNGVTETLTKSKTATRDTAISVLFSKIF